MASFSIKVLGQGYVREQGADPLIVKAFKNIQNSNSKNNHTLRFKPFLTFLFFVLHEHLINVM